MSAQVGFANVQPWRRLSAATLMTAGMLMWAGTPASADTIALGTTADFALLALNNGYLSINSATSIVGDVGASSNVAVESAQKVDSFTGATYLFSGTTTTNFIGKYADATFNPSGGIHSGNVSGCPGGDPLFSCDGAPVDAKLNQANLDAAALQTQLNALTYNPLGDVTASLDLTSGGGVNAYDASSWNYNEDVLTLHGDASSWFVFRIAGTDNNWAKSQTILDGVLANHVLFYFTADTALGVDLVDVFKAENLVQGTIFAPLGGVDYHNPATFVGRIVAESITVHSDFNITVPPPTEVPEPASLPLLGLGLLTLLRRRSRR